MRLDQQDEAHGFNSIVYNREEQLHVLSQWLRELSKTDFELFCFPEPVSLDFNIEEEGR